MLMLVPVTSLHAKCIMVCITKLIEQPLLVCHFLESGFNGTEWDQRRYNTVHVSHRVYTENLGTTINIPIECFSYDKSNGVIYLIQL